VLLQPWIPRLCLDLALDTSVLPQIIWKTVQSIDPHHRHKKFVQKTDATAAEESCNSERNCTEEEGRNTLSLEHILLLDSYSVLSSTVSCRMTLISLTLANIHVGIVIQLVDIIKNSKGPSMLP